MSTWVPASSGMAAEDTPVPPVRAPRGCGAACQALRRRRLRLDLDAVARWCGSRSVTSCSRSGHGKARLGDERATRARGSTPEKRPPTWQRALLGQLRAHQPGVDELGRRCQQHAEAGVAHHLLGQRLRADVSKWVMNMMRYGLGVGQPELDVAASHHEHALADGDLLGLGRLERALEVLELLGAGFEQEAVLVLEVPVDGRRGDPHRGGTPLRMETASAEPVSISSRCVAARISSRSRSPSPWAISNGQRQSSHADPTSGVGVGREPRHTTGSTPSGGRRSTGPGPVGHGRSGLVEVDPLAEADAVVDAPQPARRPPVRLAGQPHERRHQRGPDRGWRPSSTASASPRPNSLMNVIRDVANARNTTASSSGRRRDDPAGALEADGHRGVVVAACGRAPP